MKKEALRRIGMFISLKVAEDIKVRIKPCTCHLQQKTGDPGLHLNQQVHCVSFLVLGGGEPDSWVQSPDVILPSAQAYLPGIRKQPQ